jgi:hypothetical protein
MDGVQERGDRGGHGTKRVLLVEDREEFASRRRAEERAVEDSRKIVVAIRRFAGG